MLRREFIAALGGTVLWPLAARAQPPAMPVIGFIRSDLLSETTHLANAFRRGLREAGYVEGQNVAIEMLGADNHPERLPALVADLLGRPVAAIVTNTTAALAAKAATASVPIIFTTGGDPVSEGLVTSLNRPGGNVTGMVFLTAVLGSKRLELLRQLVPKATMVGLLVNPNAPNTEGERRDVHAAAQASGQQLTVLEASTDHDIEVAFATFVQRGVAALMVGSGAFLNSHRESVVALAMRHALPASYVWREAAVAGGLMSYGPSQTDAYRQAGIYAGRILKGEKPGDLPVVQSSKFEFVINLKTAKALGLEIHPQLLVAADELIE